MTAVTLIPNATVSSNGIILGGAADGVIAVTDANTGTGVRLYGWTYALSTFTLPAGAILRTASVTVNGRTYTGSVPRALTVSLLNAAGTQLAGYQITMPLTQATRTSTAASVSITDQATVDGLVIDLLNPFSTSGYEILVSELSVPVVYVVVPTVNVTAPTGTITTSTSTVVWTYTGDTAADASGAAQRNQVKVFTAAQYGAGGFDPGSSVPVYDTGEVVTSAKSAAVGPLPNAVTLKAYVRVAQNVNGAPHWSAWTAGPTFSVNIDPPAVATIAAVVSGPAVQVTVTRDVAHPAWTHLNFERSVGDLLSWEPVRGALELASSANTVVVSDYEMPEGVAVWYRARGIVKSGTLITAQGAWKVTSAAVTWSTTGCGEYLRDPANPASALLIEVVVDEQTMSTEHRVGLLDVIGRASPVTVWDTPSSPTGMLPIVTRTYADAVTLNNLVRTAPVLLWQGRRSWGHPHSWIVITSHTTTRAATSDATYADYREWELSYVEVDEPPVLS